MEYSTLDNGRSIEGNRSLTDSLDSVRKPEANEKRHPFGHRRLNSSSSSLRKGTRSQPKLALFDVLGHILRIVVPLALLSLLIAATTLQGRPATDDEFARWDTAISVTASLFPMLFAFVMGHAIYEVARTKLEHGTALETLEQLIGSRTLGGAIMTPFGLSAFNLLGIILLALWCLSPLGSQALLRTLSITLRPMVTNVTTVYQDVRCHTPLSDTGPVSPQSLGFYNVRFSNFAGRFGSVLQVPSDMQSDSMDIWGNVRIPFLAEEGHDEQGEGGWQDVAWTDDPSRFSSLAGLPISSLPEGNNTLDIESSYIHLDCFNKTKFSFGDHDPISITSMNVLGNELSGPDPKYLDNSTWFGLRQTNETRGGFTGANVFWEMALDRFVHPIWWDNGKNSVPGTAATSRIGRLTRRLGPARTAPNCSSRSMASGPDPPTSSSARSSTTAPWPRGLRLRPIVASPSATSRVEWTAARNEMRGETAPPSPSGPLGIARQLPLATERSAGKSDLAVQWLNHSSIKPASYANSGPTLEDEDVDLKTFSTRFAQVLNTYIVLSTYAMNLAGEEVLSPNTTVMVQNSKLELVYQLDKRWVTVAFACCGVLLASCVASLFLAFKAMSPEVLGFASSSIRDSKLIDFPPTLGSMEGLEVSKQYGKMRVRYGYSDLTLEGQRLVGIDREEETALLLGQTPESKRGWSKSGKEAMYAPA
ncbi:hypothetical protein B0T11DRAFT_14855 [Plectosphaerella cucumerina]|uniref:Uncharacterized protein n=1 Tax=Plectosphaerella cucumerina TaxID=40658 RepID=A0A8K0TVG1_9PEZI|nr:hypothetical protein B0T11DRAFT_14855 [Plectosphaerella cucumerina]